MITILTLLLGTTAQAAPIDTDAVALEVGGTLHTYSEHTIEDDSGADLVVAEMVFGITNGVAPLRLARDLSCTGTVATGCFDGHPAISAARLTVVPGGMERRVRTWGRDSLDPSAWTWALEATRVDTLTVDVGGYQGSSVLRDDTGSVVFTGSPGFQVSRYRLLDLFSMRPWRDFGAADGLNLAPLPSGHTPRDCGATYKAEYAPIDAAIAALEAYEASPWDLLASAFVASELVRLYAAEAEIDAWYAECMATAVL